MQNVNNTDFKTVFSSRIKYGPKDSDVEELELTEIITEITPLYITDKLQKVINEKENLQLYKRLYEYIINTPQNVDFRNATEKDKFNKDYLLTYLDQENESADLGYLINDLNESYISLRNLLKMDVLDKNTIVNNVAKFRTDVNEIPFISRIN